VALELPAGMREALSEWASEALTAAGAGLRAVSAESLHLTLCFLGSVAPERLDEVIQACGVAEDAPVGALRVSRALWLPRRRPRVLSVELEDPEGSVTVVQGRLSDALAAQGLFSPDARRFLPHVTVARVRGSARVRPLELEGPAGLTFDPERIVLYRSHLGGGPARYESLHVVQLSRR